MLSQLYTAKLFGEAGRRLQLITLDTRWFRSAFKPTDGAVWRLQGFAGDDARVIGNWSAAAGATAHMAPLADHLSSELDDGARVEERGLAEDRVELALGRVAQQAADGDVGEVLARRAAGGDGGRRR